VHGTDALQLRSTVQRKHSTVQQAHLVDELIRPLPDVPHKISHTVRRIARRAVLRDWPRARQRRALDWLRIAALVVGAAPRVRPTIRALRYGIDRHDGNNDAAVRTHTCGGR
jgi:hypothetical protein